MTFLMPINLALSLTNEEQKISSLGSRSENLISFISVHLPLLFIKVASKSIFCKLINSNCKDFLRSRSSFSSIYTLKYKQADLNTNTAYGYSVDKDGYMGSDFNKAAGLPEDFKIHKSTLDEIKKAAENDPVVSSTKEYLGVSSYYSNIDIANTIKQYYNLFSNALGQSFPNDKTSFSEADINSMPSGYGVSGTQWMDFNEPSNRMNITGLKDFSNSLISNVYKTPEQAKEADEI